MQNFPGLLLRGVRVLLSPGLLLRELRIHFDLNL